MREIMKHQPSGTQTALPNSSLAAICPATQTGMTEEAEKHGGHGTSVGIQTSLVLLLGRQFTN